MQVYANHWYGSSRYPVHEAQREELAALVDQKLRDLGAEVAAKMKKWNGGYDRPVLSFGFSLSGDGWDFDATEIRLS